MVQAIRRTLLVPSRYSKRFSSNPHPLDGLVFYADLWNYEQIGRGWLTNGTGIANAINLAVGDNTVTVTQAGTLIITLSAGNTGTATSGTMTVTGSPVSLVAGENTITTTGAIGNITVNVADKFVERSTNAALCTVTGATLSNQGRSFDGNDYIKHSATNWRSSDSQGSIVAWVKSSANAVQQIFTSSDEGSTSTFLQFYIESGVNAKITFDTRENGGTTNGITGSTKINDGVPHLVVISSNGSIWSMFVDNIAQTLTVWTGSNNGLWFSGVGLVSPRDNIIIGAKQTTSIGNYFNGLIGEEIIYSRALSVAEITQIYNATRWRYV